MISKNITYDNKITDFIVIRHLIQDGHSVRPDLDPNRSDNLIMFLKILFKTFI